MANEPMECPLTMNGDVIGKATVQLHPDGTVEILSSEVDVHLLLKHSQKMFEDLTLSVPMSMAPTIEEVDPMCESCRAPEHCIYTQKREQRPCGGR